MKTRFAPSPTGWMHFGNLRTALFNFLYAQRQKYGFLLRIEDTDRERSTLEFQNGILEDLKWLNLNWTEGPYLQSQRTAIYAKYYAQLEDAGLAYPCFCSEETLAVTRKIQQAAGKPPRYSGTCRNLTPEQIAKKIAAGEQATLRFKVPQDTIIEFVDLIKGPQRFAANDIGDFIIRRADGSASFMFCNAIDDAEMQVSHALRGDDHLTNTPRQIMILNALNLPHPEYGHFAMINGSDGAPLSKRNGSEAVRDLRAQGYLPLAVLNYLARLGHYYSDNDFLSLQGLAERFDLAHISTSPARHDLTHLRHWQKEALMLCSIEEIVEFIKPSIAGVIVESKYAEFATMIRDNILMPEDAMLWVSAVASEGLDFSDAAWQVLDQAGKDFFTIARDCVSKNPNIEFKELADQVKNATNCSGKQLFMPLRVALTGQLHGPELAKMLQFMGGAMAVKRFDWAILKLTTGM
jgi:glutamyl-tRNA synthetase